MLDIIIFTHLQRQYSVIEVNNKKVAGDFAAFLFLLQINEKTPSANIAYRQIAGVPERSDVLETK
jgi:hypothetical protein